MDDLRAIGCDILTLGQYLRPTANHLPVERYVTPEEFARVARVGARARLPRMRLGPDGALELSRRARARGQQLRHPGRLMHPFPHHYRVRVGDQARGRGQPRTPRGFRNCARCRRRSGTDRAATGRPRRCCSRPVGDCTMLTFRAIAQGLALRVARALGRCRGHARAHRRQQPLHGDHDTHARSSCRRAPTPRARGI